MLKITQKGNFNNLSSFLIKCKNPIDENILRKYGLRGVKALTDATPRKTGLTAASWEYEVIKTNKRAELLFYNTNIQNGAKIAIILQYGHATKNGAWVEGKDYINPVIKPLFEEMADEVWKEVTRV